MPATTDLADRYLAAWNETDPVARRAAVEGLFSADARYTDPLVDAEGRSAIEATIAAVQQQFPGFAFRSLGTADAHHQQLRFAWELGPDGQEAPIDVAVVDAEGRIASVFGFLDRVPAAA
jgi:SnoaL-like domain